MLVRLHMQPLDPALYGPQRDITLPWESGILRRPPTGGAAPPVNTVAPVASSVGQMLIGTTVQTTDGTWSGSPTFTYQWRRAGVAIGGATSSSYVLVAADIGPAIDCVVTGTNGGGSVGATSNALVWTPLLLTALRGWYRADSGIGLVGADVDTWNDQSGFGNHLSAISAAARPLFVASSAVFGAQPCVEFDGVAEYLRRVAFDSGAFVGPATQCLVAQNVTIVAGNQIMGYSNSNRPCLRQAATNAFQWIAAGGIISNATAGDLVAGGAGRLIGGWWDLANQAAFVATTVRDSKANAASAFADDLAFSIGAATSGVTPVGIRVAEAIVMNARITTPEIATLSAYATNRYGVT